MSTEIEALMHALDEEEVQMEGLTNKIEELEKVLKEKNHELEGIETSRGKLTKKLSITVTKFDELHHLSESLLTEVEKLQAQLQDRDAEISFLRQEVTRCTNDALVATQTSNRSTEDINEVITWFDMVGARAGLSHIGHSDQANEVHECKEVLKKKITSILKEIEDIQAASQRKDELLLVEKNKVEELKCKELQLNSLEDVGDDNKARSAAPEIFESEPLVRFLLVALFFSFHLIILFTTSCKILSEVRNGTCPVAFTSNIMSCNFGYYTEFVEIGSCMFIHCIFPSTNLSTKMYIFAWFARMVMLRQCFSILIFCFAMQ